MELEIIGEIHAVETIARGHEIRILPALIRRFGQGSWRKRKGFATIRLPTGEIVTAELHWYEAHGVGKRKMKIKRFTE